MTGIGTPSSHNKIPRPMVHLFQDLTQDNEWVASKFRIFLDKQNCKQRLAKKSPGHEPGLCKGSEAPIAIEMPRRTCQAPKLFAAYRT